MNDSQIETGLHININPFAVVWMFTVLQGLYVESLVPSLVVQEAGVEPLRGGKYLGH